MTGPDPVIDTNRPHPARMYDYYLNGKTHYDADRRTADRVLARFPLGRSIARAQRDLMARTTRYLTQEGIGQFLDIGTGIPTEPNLHQIAQETVPDAHVVYVDNDPIVLAHAQALLRSPSGRTEFILADVTDPDAIFAAPETTRTLDLSKPTALCLLGILQFLADDIDVPVLVRRLLDPLPSGSFLAMSVVTADFDPAMWEDVMAVYHEEGMALRTYTRAETTALFDGLDLVDPGVVPSHTWRPAADQWVRPNTPNNQVSMLAGVARKP